MTRPTLPSHTMTLLAAITARLIIGFAHAMTGVRALWPQPGPQEGRTVYFANHSSHADFVLLWATLPPGLRRTTRPVAAADYWERSALRRFMAQQVFHALSIHRECHGAGPDPVQQMADALAAGSSLIMFPEGTRNTGDEALLPLRSGLYYLAPARPQVRLVPVWIDNLQRVLPKGEIIPLPLACTVRYGEALRLHADESRLDFTARARAAMLALRPACDQTPDARPQARLEVNHSRESLCTT